MENQQDHIQAFAKQLYDGCSDWIMLRRPDIDNKFIECLTEIWNAQICNPAKNDILNAFVYCREADLKVVIVGQDPYYTNSIADGLAFSTKFEKQFVPPSLKNIFKCLLSASLIGPDAAIEAVSLKADEGLESMRNITKTLVSTESVDAYCKTNMPHHGNLIPWAKRGVLLLNTALTTTAQPDAHPFWNKYTDLVLEEIARQHPNIYFCLWGGKAEKKARDAHLDKYIDSKRLLRFKHPSPQNPGPWDCPHFSVITEMIDMNWDPFFYDVYVCGLDGSCLKNGVAASAVYMPVTYAGRNNILTGEHTVITENSTNMVAELKAAIMGLELVISQPMKPQHKFKAIFITDSEYVINNIMDFVWKPDENYKYPELRQRLRALLNMVKSQGRLFMVHVNSHVAQYSIEEYPEPKKSFYQINRVVDKIAKNAATAHIPLTTVPADK